MSDAPALTRRNLPLLLLHARECVMGHFRPLLNAHDLTEQQWRVLRALHQHGELEPRQIGELCRISSPSLAGVLARMADLGLVLRERLPHDQRRVRVTLTDTSHDLITRMAPQVEALYRDLEARLGPELLARSYTVLDELIQAIGADTATDEGA